MEQEAMMPYKTIVVDCEAGKSLTARLDKAVALAQQHRTSDLPDRVALATGRVTSDVIIMGICGHSRSRELVLGGASRTVLADMTVPVLMAH